MNTKTNRRERKRKKKQQGIRGHLKILQQKVRGEDRKVNIAEQKALIEGR